MNQDPIQLIDQILEDYREVIGDCYDGYRNHVCRMVNFCFTLGELDAEDKTKIVIAGCFHDIGIWTADTFDYLPPSLEAANGYLRGVGLDGWASEIGWMIDQHHKLRSVGDDGDLAEIFRKGDLVDFSLGLVKCGVPSDTVKAVKTQFPNAGFHKFLVRTAGRWAFRHPLSPVPVLKW